MTKQEALKRLQQAVQAYNDARDDLYSEVGDLTILDIPEDVEDAAALEYDIPASWGVPSTHELEQAIEAMQRAYSDLEDATGAFKVTATVTVTVEAFDEHEAGENVSDIIEQAFFGEDNFSVDVAKVESV